MTEREGGLPVTRVAALMLLAFVVTACASVDNTDYWWKPGMTKDEFAP